MLILGTDKIASINPFGSALPTGATNLTVQDGVVVQTSGQVTPNGGELGSETNSSGGVLAILLDHGQIRSESGGYTFLRNLVLGPSGGSLDTGAWIQTWLGTISGSGSLTKYGYGTLVLDNTSATWTGGTAINDGTLVLGRAGSNGLLPGTLANPLPVVISAGATLKFNRGSNKSFFDIFSGAGGITVANSAAIKVRLVSDNTHTGPTTLTSGALMIGQGNPGGPGASASPVGNNSGLLIFNRVENLSYGGTISGTGSMEKQATGTLTLTGTNSYTGGTTVTAGTLLVNGILGNSPITVLNGTLSGTGSMEKQATGTLTLTGTNSYTGGTTVTAGTLLVNGILGNSPITV